jgi:hypothetical protein
VRDPDLKGVGGRAWNLPLVSRVADHDACLGLWLVHSPPSHPFWPWKLVSVIHLRDIPGVKPALKRYPEAEYEFMIMAINPETCPNPDPEDYRHGYPLLEPPDVVEQFHVKNNDHDAKRILEACISGIMSGSILPDEDYRSRWKETIAGTAAHFRSGAHAEN